MYTYVNINYTDHERLKQCRAKPMIMASHQTFSRQFQYLTDKV